VPSLGTNLPPKSPPGADVVDDITPNRRALSTLPFAECAVLDPDPPKQGAQIADANRLFVYSH